MPTCSVLFYARKTTGNKLNIFGSHEARFRPRFWQAVLIPPDQDLSNFGEPGCTGRRLYSVKALRMPCWFRVAIIPDIAGRLGHENRSVRVPTTGMSRPFAPFVRSLSSCASDNRQTLVSAQLRQDHGWSPTPLVASTGDVCPEDSNEVASSHLSGYASEGV